MSVEAWKAEIDAMSHIELARRWRFASMDDPIFQGEAGEYYKKRLFDDLGGITPEISKAIGW
jgi:hypothetical protein